MPRCKHPPSLLLNFNDYNLIAISPEEISIYNFSLNDWETYKRRIVMTKQWCPPILIGNKMITLNQKGVWSVSLLSGETVLIEPLKYPTVHEGCTLQIIEKKLFLYSNDMKVVTYKDLWDLKSQEWKFASKMNEMRKHHAAVVHKNKLYVFGGIGKGDRELCSVEAYDPIKNEWETLPSMFLARSYCQALVLNEHIYLIDSRPSPVVNYMECYNPVSKTWSAKAVIPEVLPLVRTVAHKDRLITFGQHCNWQYNPLKDEWTIYKGLKRIDLRADVVLIPPQIIDLTDED